MACPTTTFFCNGRAPEARTLGGLHRRQTFCRVFATRSQCRARPGLPRRVSLGHRQADLDPEEKSSVSPIKNAASDRCLGAQPIPSV